MCPFFFTKNIFSARLVFEPSRAAKKAPKGTWVGFCSCSSALATLIPLLTPDGATALYFHLAHWIDVHTQVCTVMFDVPLPSLANAIVSLHGCAGAGPAAARGCCALRCSSRCRCPMPPMLPAKPSSIAKLLLTLSCIQQATPVQMHTCMPLAVPSRSTRPC